MRTLWLLAAMCLVQGAQAALTAPGASPLTTVTRHNNGDLFTAPGEECNIETCVGLSSGTAGAAPVRPGHGRSCTCRCLDHLPAYRDDLHICVDDIHECALAPFVSGSTSQQIPFVFLPLKGQIVHPSKEISFAGVKTPICAVSGAQFLTDSGWIDLRNAVDNDVPFRLFRDEGRTFLQWLGDGELRAKMAGRLILVQMLCKDLAKDPIATDLKSIFTPCVAFRVAGTPVKYISNVSEVIFSPDAHASENGSTGGLTISEYIAIGICSVLLGLIYVASVFLYLHIRRRKRKECVEKELDRRDDQSISPPEEGIVKNNPLLSFSRHYTAPESNFSDDASSDNEIPPDILQHHDDRKKTNMQVTAAIIHPLNENFSLTLNQTEPVQLQDTSSIERLPEENVSIIETLEGREERPETVKTIVSATTRRKLYFNPAYFEPHLLLAPPPAAIEFLTKIREVISIAKHKMASKKFTPSLLGIPEEDSNQNLEPFYEFSLAAASSRRSSMISLKRENSRRKSLECSGCPGCEPHDLKSLCGRLPEFPSVAMCQSCSSSTSSVSESKQQSIRKWLEDVPILKSSMNDEEIPEISDTTIALVKSLQALSSSDSPVSSKRLTERSQFPEAYREFPGDNYTTTKSEIFLEECITDISKKDLEIKLNSTNDKKNSFFADAKSLPTGSKATERKKSPRNKIKSNKAKAPQPPVATQKKLLQPTEDIKPNISNHYDVIRNIRSPSPKINLPPPDMINEAMVVDKAEEVPEVTKQMMAAVIHEFSSHCSREPETAATTDLNLKVASPSPELNSNPNVEYETDSLERSNKNKNGYSTPTDYADVSSSQPSPSLSTALPMDEEMTMRNEIFNVNVRNVSTYKQAKMDDEHEYELIVLKKQDKTPLIHIKDKKLYNLPELLHRSNGYNLVSEVYVNNGYNFGSSPSTPSGSNASTLENLKPKIRYEQPEEKPGHLTIEVEDCPDNYIKVEESDCFEPDTLDRKPKMKITNLPDSTTTTSDFIDSLERPRQILLKTTGSFKSDTLSNSSDTNFGFNSNFNRTFGSLREIYEAKTRNYLRPGLDNINFFDTSHSLNSDTLRTTLSWKKYKENDEGKLLTLEERQKKRQRPSPNGTIRQIPPDVIPPSPIPSPIYEQPKPPRKVIENTDSFKPPLPPKNGIGRSTRMKTHSTKLKENSSPFSSISLDLPSSPSGVSACSSHSSDGTYHSKRFIYEDKSKSIVQNFLHSDDVIFNNGINNQFILHASTITSNPTFDTSHLFPPKPNVITISRNSPQDYSYTKELDRIILDKNQNDTVKKTWRKLVDMSSVQLKEDSGYLSTDSNESFAKKKKMDELKEVDKESETDESLGDGHSESGAESIETHSVFFGSYRKFSRAAESIDSGIESEFAKHIEDIMLLEDITSDAENIEVSLPG